MREAPAARPWMVEDEDIEGISRSLAGWQAELIYVGRGSMRRTSIVASVGAARFALLHVRRPTALRVVAPSSDYSLILTAPASPPLRVRSLIVGRGAGVAFGPRGAAEVYLPGDCCAFILSMTCDEIIGVRGHAAALPAQGCSEVRQHSVEHADLLIECMALLESVRQSETPDAVARRGERRLTYLLSSSAAGVFLHLQGPSQEGGERALRRQAVARACSYIEAQLRQPITLDDLCEAAGVRARTLEYGFREFYDAGPMAYVRSVRLCRVRRDLSEAHRLSAAVTTIARRWGFTHMGQFSRDYRILFGENPSTTLVRARISHRAPPSVELQPAE